MRTSTIILRSNFSKLWSFLAHQARKTVGSALVMNENAQKCTVEGSSLKEVNILTSPAAERNKEHILNVIREHIDLDKKLLALELASGSGAHVVHFAEHLPNVTWQPSDCDPNCVSSEAGYMLKKNSFKNVLTPAHIDVSQPMSDWNVASLQHGCDLIVCINMIHITDMKSVVGLFKSAGQLLKPGAILFTYGPYMENGVITPESNVQFDQSLKSRDARWGLRDINDLKTMASENNIAFEKKIDMPANNKVLIFKKSS